PSAYISSNKVDHFVDTLQMFFEALRAADVAHLTSYQVGCQPGPIVDFSGSRLSRREAPRTPKRVAFIGHLLQPEHALLWDASLISLKHKLLESMEKPSRILMGTI